MSRSFFRFVGPVLASGLVLVGAFPLLGCGDDEESLPGVPLEQFSQQFQGATCEHLVACNFMPDNQTCMSVVGAEQGIVQAVASVNAGDLTYDTNAARACIDALRSAPCTGNYLIPRSIRETCDPVFGNRKAEGEPCYHAAECQGLNAVCEGSCTDRCCAGTCRLEAGFAAIGESCANTPCGEDAWCSTADPANPVCAVKVGPGDSCALDPNACPLGYACDPGTATCFKQADPGGACNPDLAADGCYALGEYCDAESRKCVPLPAVGESCESNAFGTNFCAPGYAYCDGGTTTCTALPKEGEACPGDVCLGMGLGSGIPSGLTCQGGTCTKSTAVPACVGP